MSRRKRPKKLVPLEYTLDPYLIPFGLLLFLSTFGRGIGHFSIDPPYRALWWNESILEPLFYFLPWEWSDYALHPQTDPTLRIIEHSIGFIYIGCAFFILSALFYLNRLIRKVSNLHTDTPTSSTSPLPSSSSLSSTPLPATGNQRLTSPPQILAPLVYTCWILFVLQLFYLLCQWQDHIGQWGTLLEGATHLSLPLILLCILPYQTPKKSPYFWVLFALIGTFFGHGLYAMNIYPLPAHFTTMVMDLLSISQNQAIWFLYCVGILDLICSFLLLLPLITPHIIKLLIPFFPPTMSKHLYQSYPASISIQRAALLYMGLWGILTALARVCAHWYDGPWIDVLWLWGPETLYRLPQGGLALWWIWRSHLPSNVVSSYSDQIYK